MDRFAPRFITHVIFARKPLIDSNPAEVGTFVNAFFAVLDYMRAHRDKTIEIADSVIHDGENVVSGAYDREMPLMSKDGTFDPEALKLIKQSWVDLKTLPSVPNDDQILTRRFVPVKIETSARSR
jgi:ABC-type nitrate/sulfonate/bicarbonate transport system substrate-binding protein